MKKCIIVGLAISIFAYGCRSKKANEMNNPFFQTWNTPYQVPPFDKIKVEHYLPAFEEGMRMQMAEIDTICQNSATPTFANTIETMEYSGALLDKVSSVFFNLLETDNNEEMQSIAETIAPLLSEHNDNINMNKDLFLRVKYVYEHQQEETLTEEQTRLLEETYKNFIRGGANLTGQQQERFKAINQEIAELTLKFNNNVLAATNAYRLIIDDSADLNGLPSNVTAVAKEEADKHDSTKGKWVFTLQNPSLLPFLEYAGNREKRREIWEAYASRCNGGNYDNNDIINRLVNLRIERAHLLGYASHADFILDENMAKTPAAAYDLLLKVWQPAIDKAKQELAMYQQKAGKEKIEPWDWRYYTELIRKEKYDLDQDSIRSYFPLENTLKGMFSVAEKLYNITLRINKDIPTYGKDVIAYEVIDNNQTIGILYMDFYVRPTKSSGAWMTEFRNQHLQPDGSNVIPVISVVYNFSQPAKNTPSLLTIDDVQTLFHEFGHALHGLFSKCRYKSTAGTNVARDFVELPSQIMENWAVYPEVMKMISKHYITGEAMNDELINTIQQSLTYGQGFANTELIAASLLDMDYHTLTEQTDIHPDEFEQACMNKYGLIQEIIPRYKSQYFKHIFTDAFGYSAGYYSYTWSAVLDADAFEMFKENGIFNKETATKFRTCILEKGNTMDPMKAYINFRGRTPDITPLLKNRGLK